MTLKDFLIEHKPEIICLFVGAVIATFFYIVVIGRKKAKWFVCEIVKMYSAKETSYFSKKRAEGGVSFLVLQWGMMFALKRLVMVPSFDMFQMLAWATVEAFMCGYYLNNIQKEKKMNLEAGKEKENTNTETKPQ